MHTVAKSMLAAIFVFFGALIGSTSMFAVSSPQTVNLPDSANYSFDDDDEPEVKARVARISFISGEAKIRRNGTEEWEKATLNLPLVEGDEIATDSGTRLEIQFDKNSHARLDENAFLRIISLKDEAVALSLNLGTMSVRVTAFDRERSSFEIDAPKTTVAVQRSGSYRIDAGRDGDGEIRVSAREDGEARVYSDNSGFTLKNGRSARIFIGGPNAGEWALADASQIDDDFERWSAKRERVVAQSLATAHYDKYYDNDIYGADDLSNSGEWIYISGYGQVWRPYSSSISYYNDWSPYRYGQWRWMQPYGWIWVNDEPWGWATYHHGRWFYHHGRWYWSPYGYYRPRRSWWFPALVSIVIYNNNTCWYPLSYRHRWQNYNWRHNRRNNLPPNQGNQGPVRDPRDLSARKEVPGEVDGVPVGGIVTTPTNTFGNGSRPFTRPPQEVAKTILARKPGDGTDGLPGYRISSEVVSETPRNVPASNGAKTGAAMRTDRPLDSELRDKTVLGGRPPRNEAIRPPVDATDQRKTGVFDRPPVKTDNGGSIRYTPSDSPRFEPPAEVKETPVRKDPPVRYERPKEEPRYNPPPVKEQPRDTRPPVRDTPRYEPPPAKREAPPERKAPPASKDNGDVKKDKPQ